MNPHARRLPFDVARCAGKGHDGPGGFVLPEECGTCQRCAVPGFYGDPFNWISPPSQSPCPVRIEKGEE